jgi:hypothetical protein
MRLKLICCQVLCRESADVVRRSPHLVEVEFLSKGLHEIPCSLMRDRIQEAVDGVPAFRCDAVLLGYGLCSHGLAGIVARTLPVVIPRAHDCITLLLGSRRRYDDSFHQNPGTYFQSIGWVEHRVNPPELEALSIAGRHGLRMSWEERVQRYGEDNARYLEEVLGDHTRHYGRMAFIRSGVEPDAAAEQECEAEARRRGWAFDRLAADLGLLGRMVNGAWNDDFVVLAPGERSVATHDGRILDKERVTQ